MKKRVMVVCGYGPGISSAVARRFGNEGFELALVSRSGDKLERAVAGFAGEGIVGTPFDDGSATITADRVADAFWQQYTDRGPVTVKVTAV